MTDSGGQGDAGQGAGDATAAGIGDQGAKSWMEGAGFPVDLQSNPTLQKFENPVALGKSYLELQQLVGGERLALPKPDAPPEEWGRVWEKLGRPESANEYGLSEFRPPEGLPWSGEFVSKMAEKLHAHGLSTKQAQGVVKDYAELLAGVHSEVVQKEAELGEQARVALREKHGAAYDTKLHNAKKAVRALLGESETDGTPGLLDRIKLSDGRLLGDHPDVIELFMAIGEKIGEDPSVPGAGETRTTLTPEEAKRQLTEMMGDEKQMAILMNKQDPQHEALQAKRTALEKMAYPRVGAG
jgi:hypothetical protein